MLRTFRALPPLRFISCRTIRTLQNTKSNEVIDVESQLSGYPPETRKEILDQIRQINPPEQLKNVDQATFYAGFIQDYLANATTNGTNVLDEPFWETVENMAQHLIKTKSNRHTELLVQLFEVAKSLETASRQRIIYKLGRCIYQHKTVRFDPINEVEFLDSLVAQSRPFHALKLWESRKSKDDVQKSKFWSEMGVLYHLDAGLIGRADSMAREQLPDTTLRVVLALINAWSHQVRRRLSDAEPLQFWLKQFLISESDMEAEDVENALAALVTARQWDLAAQLLGAVPVEDCSVVVPALKVAAATQLPHEQDFMPFFETLLTKYPELASDFTIGSSLALYFAKVGDFEAANEIIEDLNAQGQVLTPAFLRQLAREQIKRQNVAHDMGELGALELLNYVSRHPRSPLRNKAAQIARKYAGDAPSSVNPQLAYAILRFQHSELPTQALIDLASTHPRCQALLWYLQATHKVQLPSTILLDAMNNETPVAETLVAMCQAYANEGTVDKAFLEILHHKFSQGALPAEAALVMKAQAQLRKLHKLPLRRPRFGPVVSSNSTRIPWA